MTIQYTVLTAYRSKFDDERLFSTPLKAQKFDIESAATLITKCTYDDVITMTRDYQRNDGLRRAIAFLAELSK